MLTAGVLPLVALTLGGSFARVFVPNFGQPQRGVEMTRKDYELIACVLRTAPIDGQTGLPPLDLVWAFADALAETNPRFDRQRFITAACAGVRS